MRLIFISILNSSFKPEWWCSVCEQVRTSPEERLKCLTADWTSGRMFVKVCYVISPVGYNPAFKHNHVFFVLLWTDGVLTADVDVHAVLLHCSLNEDRPADIIIIITPPTASDINSLQQNHPASTKLDITQWCPWRLCPWRPCPWRPRSLQNPNTSPTLIILLYVCHCCRVSASQPRVNSSDTTPLLSFAASFSAVATLSITARSIFPTGRH